MSKVKVFLNSFLYSFNSILIKAINLILLPIYTKILPPKDYGTINLINSFYEVAIYICAFSVYSAIIRFYADYKDNSDKLKRFYSTVIIFVTVSGIFFMFMGFISHELLTSWFFEGIPFYPVIVIALLNLTFICLRNIHQSIMQGMQQGKKLITLNLSVFIMQAGINLLFICIFKLGAIGILLSSLIVDTVYMFYMLFDLKRHNLITFCFDFIILGEVLSYSVPLLPHNLSTHIASFASRIFINNSSSLASVGLYSVASQFSLVIDTIQSSVNKAFVPWFYGVISENSQGGKREAVNLSRLLLILYSLLYICIGLFSQEVILLLTSENYFLAWTVIPILVIAFSVKSLYYFFVNILFYYKETAKKIFIATITGSLADILLAVLLVPRYGMYGAACAFLIAKIIVVTIVILLSKKHDDIGYRATEMFKIVFPSILFMCIGLLFSYTKYPTTFSLANTVYKFGVLSVYLLFVYFTNRKMISQTLQSEKMQHTLRKYKIIKLYEHFKLSN